MFTFSSFYNLTVKNKMTLIFDESQQLLSWLSLCCHFPGTTNKVIRGYQLVYENLWEVIYHFMLLQPQSWYRSSHQRCSMKDSVFRNFIKHLWWLLLAGRYVCKSWRGTKNHFLKSDTVEENHYTNIRMESQTSQFPNNNKNARKMRE